MVLKPCFIVSPMVHEFVRQVEEVVACKPKFTTQTAFLMIEERQIDGLAEVVLYRLDSRNIIFVAAAVTILTAKSMSMRFA